MQAFKSFAKTRLGDLKEALIEADELDDDDEEDEDDDDDEAEEPVSRAAGAAPAGAQAEPGPPVPPPDRPPRRCGPPPPERQVSPPMDHPPPDRPPRASATSAAEAADALGVEKRGSVDGKAESVTAATPSEASVSTAAGDADSAPARPLVATWHGAGIGTASDLQPCGDEEARREFAATLAVPGLRDVLQATCGQRSNAVAFSWDSTVAQPVSRIAVQCAVALRTLAPQILAADDKSDTRRLLTSFGERYDDLLHQYNKLQHRCREMVVAKDSETESAAQVEIWQSAHRAATDRVQELASENADLKERARALEANQHPEETKHLQWMVAQRDAEVAAYEEAVKRLQDAVESSASAHGQRTAQLEGELAEARQQLQAVESLRAAEANGLDAASSAAKQAKEREAAMEVRCRTLERDAQDTQRALDGLLMEKERHLEERDNHVDRRVVTSMLALYLDHLQSGDKVLSDLVLDQTLHVLGTERAAIVADRKRILAAAEPRAAEPLSDAFLDFLTRETSEAVGE